MRYKIRPLFRTIIPIAFALISFQIFFNAPASTAVRSGDASADWEERVLGLRRPNQIRNDLFWRSQALLDSNRAKGKKDRFSWLLRADLFERLSPTAQNYLIERYKLTSLNPQSAIRNPQSNNPQSNNPQSNQSASSFGGNIKINDSAADTGSGVQNQTSSASSGDAIVVVYNHSSNFRTRAASSADGGATWRESIVASVRDGFNLGDGVAAANAQGDFFVSTAALNAEGLSTIAVSKSTDSGARWFTASNVLSTGVTADNFYNRPWIAIDSTDGRFRGSIYVCFTKFEAKGRAAIMLARSTNGGATFNAPVEITPDAKGFGTDGSRVALGPSGEIYVAWFNDRTGTIDASRSLDGGASFSKPIAAVSIGNNRTPEFLNGHFKTNTFPSIAVDQSNGETKGRAYIVYNARQSVNSPDKSDVFMVASSDGGQTWSAPLRINDDQTETDQWMPSAAVTPSGRVAALWYDRRNDRLSEALIDVYAAVSFDGGKSFRRNLRITSGNWAVVPTPEELRFGYHGDYNQISSRGELLNLNWGDDRNGTDPNVFFASIPSDAAPVDDFTIFSRTPAVELRAGEEAVLQMESRKFGEFSGVIKLSAESNLPGLKVEFSPEEIRADNGFSIKISVPPNAQTRTYPLIVSGSSNGETRTTTLQIAVLSNIPFVGVPQNISRSTGNSERPKLMLDDQGITHLIWQDDTAGSSQITYSRSLDGERFSQPFNISRSVNSAVRPDWALDSNGRIHVVWEERQNDRSFIVYTRSDDGGESFTPKRIVSSGADIAFDASIEIAPDGVVYLFFSGKAKADEDASAIFMSRSFDGGENFLNPKEAVSSIQNERILFEPAAAIDQDGVIHLAYSSMIIAFERFGSPVFRSSVSYVRSSNEGEIFTEPVNLFENASFADSAILLIDQAGTLYLIFAAFDPSQPFPSREIYLTRSFDNGASFTPPALVSNGNGDSTNISAGIDPSGNVNILWRDTLTGNNEIFLNRFFAKERTFIGVLNISQNIGISNNPSIFINARGDIAIAWEDETMGNNEIFYKRFAIEDLRMPAINGFSPQSGATGDAIEVRGSNFVNILDVRIGRFSVKISVVGDDKLTLTVPNGITTGPIQMITRSGIAVSADDFLVTGKVGAAPTRLDFGRLGIDKSGVRTIKIINTDRSARTVSTVAFENSSFGLGDVKLPIKIEAGASIDLPIVFKPKNLSLQTARAVIISDDRSPTPLTISLVGIGTDDAPPTVTVRAPLGGEIFRPGDQVDIDWEVADRTAAARQDILFSMDDGKSFTIPIASGITGIRTFKWTVPEFDVRAGRVRVVVVDAAGNRGEGTSQSFRIKKRR